MLIQQSECLKDGAYSNTFQVYGQANGTGCNCLHSTKLAILLLGSLCVSHISNKDAAPIVETWQLLGKMAEVACNGVHIEREMGRGKHALNRLPEIRPETGALHVVICVGLTQRVERVLVNSGRISDPCRCDCEGTQRKRVYVIGPASVELPKWAIWIVPAASLFGFAVKTAKMVRTIITRFIAMVPGRMPVAVKLTTCYELISEAELARNECSKMVTPADPTCTRQVDYEKAVGVIQHFADSLNDKGHQIDIRRARSSCIKLGNAIKEYKGAHDQAEKWRHADTIYDALNELKAFVIEQRDRILYGGDT